MTRVLSRGLGAGALAVGLGLTLTACARESDRAPNVLLISIDTLRGDRLGCNGYERDTTPALDRLARQHAVRFARAVAEAPWTLPSHVTMLSGLHPLRHGVRQPDQAPGPEVELLAQRLASTHYTFAVTDGGWLSEPWGFEAGFASFRAEDRDIERSVSEVIEYIRHRQQQGPWFGFLHTFDVHCPYDPPASHAARFESADAEPIEVAGRCGNPFFNSQNITPGQARFLSDRYDDDVRRVDDALGRLLEVFDELDLWRDTVLIVTSDHGDEFLEHGSIGHERSLQREVLDIPLLIAAPGLGPRVVQGPVALADIVPTVLELLGRAPARLDGLSLVAAMGGDARLLRERTILSDLAWQSRLAAESSATGSRVLDLDRIEEGLGGELQSRRAALLRAGLEPRQLDYEPLRPELSRLGY